MICLQNFRVYLINRCEQIFMYKRAIRDSQNSIASWTNPGHRLWVRVSHLRQIVGYDYNNIKYTHSLCLQQKKINWRNTSTLSTTMTSVVSWKINANSFNTSLTIDHFRVSPGFHYYAIVSQTPPAVKHIRKPLEKIIRKNSKIYLIVVVLS